MQSAKTVAFIAPPHLDFLYDPVEPRLRAAGVEVIRVETPEQLMAHPTALARASVIFGSGRISREMMLAAPNLRAVVAPVAGYNGIDDKAATELGIVLANGAIPENHESMAEAAIMLMLVASYDLRGTEAVLRHNLPRPRHLNAHMLRDRVIGLVGFGRQAQSVAERLKPWGAKLVAYFPRPKPEAEGLVERVDLDTLLATSDIVSLHSALNAETYHMLDARRLALMKPEVIFVNTARGGLVDEAALCRLARERPGMRLALDAFEIEPLPADSPLRDLPNAILTPHQVGHTTDTHERFPEAAYTNIANALEGTPPPYVVNPGILPAWQRRWATGD